ncbi:helix-turn-helix transcriptional regulator [Diplocloster agilis]|uniref:Helix-turn-helix transcriptional regulator n=1 Tax=Diplocloster agilis TaxID=2850323 RepID=A0A949JZM6_9FIRM|nr:helix-turn-helix transcriptional regulator [Diplocloster agilis]MBU9737019.1 helix-turn-helix transcriptional regulator [Diplocloster agilis]
MKFQLEFLKQVARGITKQFGQNCEVVIHDLTTDDLEHSIAFIENGHVSNRALGDGPSHVVLETLRKGADELQDHLGYLTRTTDGRILKSSTIYIRNDQDQIRYIFSINYDITALLTVENALKSLTATETTAKEPEKITQNVNDLLDDLIEQSVVLVGKPVAMMNKEDKVRAIQFLNEAGAFLITKSGDKVSNYFGISKYTLYSYLDAGKENGGA